MSAHADLRSFIDTNSVEEQVSDCIALIMTEFAHNPNPVGVLADLLGTKATGGRLPSRTKPRAPADVEQLKFLLEDAIVQAT
eukprot:3755188-Prymnesium_polylepis.1